MSNVTEIEGWLNKKAEENSAPLQAHLHGFSKRIADLSFGDGMNLALGLQALCAGWQGYLDLEQTTRWWWPCLVPIFHGPEQTGKGIRVDFVNGRAKRPEGDPAPVFFKFELFQNLRTTFDDTDYSKLLENLVRSFPEEGALNPIYAPLCILFFAKKDMDFKYHSHSVEGHVITITVDALTERMVITFDAAQCIGLLESLKEQVDRLNRRGAKTEDPNIPPIDLPE